MVNRRKSGRGRDNLSANTDRPNPAGASTPARSTFRIELSLSVADASALWNAALDKGLAAPAATREDLIEVIGPSQDPDLAACLAMLTAPAAIAGCRLEDFEVVEIPAAHAQAAANDQITGNRAFA
jgi:hypothetical protein